MARRVVCGLAEVMAIFSPTSALVSVDLPAFGRPTITCLARLGGRPVWRQGVLTDNGCDILDVHDLQIDDPVALERAINQIPGVVTNGLFAQRGADVLVIGTDTGVRTLLPGDR